MAYSTDLLRQMRFTIGQNIHRHRVQRKLLLCKLARRSGLSESLIDRYELGKNEIGVGGIAENRLRARNGDGRLDRYNLAECLIVLRILPGVTIQERSRAQLTAV